MKFLFLFFALFASGALADPVPGVRSGPTKEKELFVFPKVKPANRRPPREGAPPVLAPQKSFTLELAPAVAKPDTSAPDPNAHPLRPHDNSCQGRYASLFEPNRMGLAGKATAATLYTTAAAALAAKAAYEQLPKAEDRDSSHFRVKTREQLVAEAQSYLKNRFYRSRRLFGDYLNKDFSFGQWLLSGEFAQNGGNRDEFAEAGATYADLVAKAKQVKESDLPFLEKIQAVRRLVVENPGILSGYCSEKTNLNEALLHHCGNCEASMKTYISLLHDAEILIEPPYELGVQLFSDHIQPVLLNKETQAVIDLDSGNTVTELKENIYRPELLLWGYLRGQQADTIVDRKKDLILAALPENAEINAQDFDIQTDTFFNFGGARSASSYSPPPAFGRRKMSEKKLGAAPVPSEAAAAAEKSKNKSLKDGKKGGSGSAKAGGGGGNENGAATDAYGDSFCQKEATNTKIPNFDGFLDSSFSTNGYNVGFLDENKRNRWNQSSPMERWTAVKKMIQEETAALALRPDFTNAMAAWEKGDAQEADVPKEVSDISWHLYYLTMLGSNLQYCINADEFPFSKERVRRELVSTPTSLKIEEILHRRGAAIADNPMAEIRRLKKMKPEEIFNLGSWNALFRRVSVNLENSKELHLPLRPQSMTNYFRTKAGNIYYGNDPYAAIYSTLADPKKVEVAQEGSKTKPIFAKDEIELPSISLTPGDYGGIVVLPKTAEEKTAPLTMPADTMAAILNIEAESMGYPSAAASNDYLNVLVRISDRLTDDVFLASQKFHVSPNIYYAQLPYAQIEAMKTIPALRDSLRRPLTLWNATVYSQVYKGQKDGKAIYEPGTTPTNLLLRDKTPKIETYTQKEKMVFDGEVSDINLTKNHEFSLKISGQTIVGEISVDITDPRGPIGISFGPFAWVCEKTCTGSPDFKDVIGDPKLSELKAKLERDLDPSTLARLKKMKAF